MIILGICLLYILRPAWAHHFDNILDRAVKEYARIGEVDEGSKVEKVE